MLLHPHSAEAAKHDGVKVEYRAHDRAGEIQDWFKKAGIKNIEVKYVAPDKKHGQPPGLNERYLITLNAPQTHTVEMDVNPNTNKGQFFWDFSQQLNENEKGTLNKKGPFLANLDHQYKHDLVAAIIADGRKETAKMESNLEGWLKNII